jgi:hypothetical protein
MQSCTRAAWLAVIVAVVAPLAVPSPALGSARPKFYAHHYVFKSLGEGGEEGDYQWAWGVTICTSRAARIRIRDIMVEADVEDSVGIGSLSVVKQKAGCKRHRLYSLGPNFRTVRSRLHLTWGHRRIEGPWRSATCRGCS